MSHDPHVLFASPTLAETALADGAGSRRQIRLEGYGPARRSLAILVAIALATGATLPVRAAGDRHGAASVCRLELGIAEGQEAPQRPRAVCAAGGKVR